MSKIIYTGESGILKARRLHEVRLPPPATEDTGS